MRPDIAAVAGLPIAQEWILDWDYGNGYGVDELEASAGPNTRIIVRQRAMSGVDYGRLNQRCPRSKPAVGYFPTTGMRCHWIIREEHGHFMGD